jgi:hypothetical protein
MWDRCHCHERDSTGVLAIMFSIACFVVAIYCFTVAIIAAHVWLIVTVLLRLLDRQWWRATWWFAVLLCLLYVDGTVLGSLDLS